MTDEQQEGRLMFFMLLFLILFSALIAAAANARIQALREAVCERRFRPEFAYMNGTAILSNNVLICFAPNGSPYEEAVEILNIGAS